LGYVFDARNANARYDIESKVVHDITHNAVEDLVVVQHNLMPSLQAVKTNLGDRSEIRRRKGTRKKVPLV
jgi:hypothetical protein